MGARLHITWVIFLVALAPAFAQLNIETGFDWLAIQDAALDEAIATHNDQLNYQKEFANLDHLVGFRLGLRYFLGSKIYTGFTWTLHMQSNKATNPVALGSLTRRIYLQSNAWQVMLGASGKTFGLGTGLSYDLVSTRRKWEGDSRSIRLDRNGGLHQEAWLEWLLPGTSALQLSIQPYARYQFGTRSTLALQQWLNDSVKEDSGLDPWGFGIRIILVNGPNPH